MIARGRSHRPSSLPRPAGVPSTAVSTTTTPRAPASSPGRSSRTRRARSGRGHGRRRRRPGGDRAGAGRRVRVRAHVRAVRIQGRLVPRDAEAAPIPLSSRPSAIAAIGRVRSAAHRLPSLARSRARRPPARHRRDDEHLVHDRLVVTRQLVTAARDDRDVVTCSSSRRARRSTSAIVASRPVSGPKLTTISTVDVGIADEGDGVVHAFSWYPVTQPLNRRAAARRPRRDRLRTCASGT